jgi:hypothetical protein
MADQFFDPSDEPKAECGNCDSWIEDMNGHHHCMNKQSIKYGLLPDVDYGCKNFFPDPRRWPEADHD